MEKVIEIGMAKGPLEELIRSYLSDGYAIAVVTLAKAEKGELDIVTLTSPYLGAGADGCAVVVGDAVYNHLMRDVRAARGKRGMDDAQGKTETVQ